MTTDWYYKHIYLPESLELIFGQTRCNIASYHQRQPIMMYSKHCSSITFNLQVNMQFSGHTSNHHPTYLILSRSIKDLSLGNLDCTRLGLEHNISLCQQVAESHLYAIGIN